MNHTNLGDIFIALGQNLANRPALIAGERTVTFGAFAASASQAAHALQEAGIGANQNVGICLRDGVETAIYLVAVWLVDATAIIIDFRAPAAERIALADEFDLTMIISDTAPANAPYRSIACTPEWKGELLRRPASPPVTARNGNGIAVIALTSGTTGRPLGLVVHHLEVLARVGMNVMRAPPDDGAYLVCSPLHFSAARSVMVDRMLRGRTVILYPPLFSPSELAEDVIRLAPTGLFVVPTVLRGLLEYARDKPPPLFPSLREFLCGSSVTRPQEKRDAVRLISSAYRESYASSLSGGISELPAADVEKHADSVGRPLPLLRLELVDENDVPVPPGEAGNVRVRSAVMTSATYKDRARDGGDRLKDGWIYPGDIARLDQEGFLHVVGRSSETIIRGGGNVHPSEIEGVIGKHPAVKEVFALGYAAEREGEEIGALVVPRVPLTETDLIAFSRANLPPDKRPRRFLVMDKTPLTTVGKPDKKAMRKLFET